MVAKIFEPIPDVINRYTGLSRRALEWASVHKELMDAAKEPGFDPERWNVLVEFVDEQRFRRVGTVKEEMGFADFLSFMITWAPKARWEGTFKRLNEFDNVVVLELEERIITNSGTHPVNTISVYEFDEAGKLVHLDVYMQSPAT